METTIKKYKLEDSIRLMPSIPYGHLVFAILFVAPFFGDILTHPHALICLGMFLFFFLTKHLTRWQNQRANVISLLLYITMLLIEFLHYGIPASAIDYSQGYQLSKGVMMDILIASIPYIYLGLRIALVFPILNLVIVYSKVHNN